MGIGITEYSFENREEWLAIRSKFIGGSDAGAVLGMNPYKSRYTLWCEKTGRIAGFEGNTTTRVGAFLEELVAQMFEEETGKKVRKKNFTLVNDLYPFACANVDRMVVGEKAFLEIKTTNSPVILKQLRETEFPDAYYAQCVHYLAVTGLEKAYLAVLSESRNFKIYELQRDQAEIDALMEAEKEFWKLVETDTQPALDGMDSTTDSIKVLYPEANDDAVDLTPYSSDIEAYVSITAQIKELNAIKETAANNIRSYMKEAGLGLCAGYSISNKNQSRKTFDKDLFVKEYPQIDIDKFFKESNSRVLKISAKKGK